MAKRGFREVAVFFSTDSIWVKINHLCILPTNTKQFAQGTRHIGTILFQGA
jgi:hypothetical protein